MLPVKTDATATHQGSACRLTLRIGFIDRAIKFGGADRRTQNALMRSDRACRF